MTEYSEYPSVCLLEYQVRVFLPSSLRFSFCSHRLKIKQVHAHPVFLRVIVDFIISANDRELL